MANSLSWEEGNSSREGERKTKCVFDGVNMCVLCFLCCVSEVNQVFAMYGGLILLCYVLLVYYTVACSKTITSLYLTLSVIIILCCYFLQ